MAGFSSVRPATASPSAISKGMSKEQFRDQLKAAISNKWFSPPNVRCYTAVRVLTISWDADVECGLCIGWYPMDLGQLFFDKYNYWWDHLSLENNDSDPQETFEEKLKEVFSDMNDDCLVVIYYVGHGREQRGTLVLEPSSDGSIFPGVNGRRIDFTKAQHEIINIAKPHVLTLLDCRHPPVEALRTPGKEIIAASMVPQTPSARERPFSARLIEVLKDEANRKYITSASLLFSKLANKLFETTNHKEDSNLSSLPVFFPSSPGSPSPVCLAPIYDDDEEERWRPSPLLNTEAGPLRVILAADLFDAEDICSVPAAYEWLKDPMNLGLKPFNSFTFSRVSIQKVHDTATGTRIVFMVPLDLWANLPEMSGVSFLSFDLKRRSPDPVLENESDGCVGNHLNDESSFAGGPAYGMTDFDEKEPVKRCWAQ
ncbi:hypothetical protein CkaCkLH20_06743 [Colletotrichum karsti]|uniref:Caspase domain-containing protein n=1 Tax=Colletotrichum karsti TaxID=1095194 RepID=A0A9P6I8A6_9PEZI|nr:uncharacterized protein CkaCkLH20_06743 [Colletotrichum karsti]KAF9875811.1 hypothetical protein CkaCkLH20_06743 [Colletotrichum karsti]